MSAHNFWNNFTHGFMHGMFNSNPFFGCFGGWSMFNTWNSNLFLYPNMMCNGSIFPMMQTFALPTFTFNSSIFNNDFNFTYDNKTWQGTDFIDSFQKTGNNSASTAAVKNDDAAFKKMLEFVLAAEGGYVANDCGEAGNRGVRQSTYDSYRKNKGLPARDVKQLTMEETEEIYYSMYYTASGADKIKDTHLAFQVFDTAVNMGVSKAKELLSQSNNNPDRFEELRLARYESIAANDSSKAKYLNGWKNRVRNLEDFADKNFTALA